MKRILWFVNLKTKLCRERERARGREKEISLIFLPLTIKKIKSVVASTNGLLLTLR